jgi:LIM domain-containing protein
MKSAERCQICRGKISGDHIQVENTFFHPECMKCQVCKEVQTVCFLTFKDLPICEKHFKEIAPTCFECGKIVTGQVFTFNDRVLCENDFKALEMAEEYGECASCGDPLSPVDSVTISGVPFHHACLLCVVCKKSLEGKMVTLDAENKPYCTKDYTKRFSVVCAGCKKAITPKKGETKASRLRAMEKDYHLECFKCSDCSLVLKPGVKGKECWPIKSKLFCYKCYIRRPTARES